MLKYDLVTFCNVFVCFPSDAACVDPFSVLRWEAQTIRWTWRCSIYNLPGVLNLLNNQNANYTV